MAQLEIHHINVGQGDSTLIINRNIAQLRDNIGQEANQLTDEDCLPFAVKKNADTMLSTNPVRLDNTIRAALLIDAGESVYGIDVDAYLSSYGVNYPTNKDNFYTLATHFHSDHVNGFKEVFFKDFDIKKPYSKQDLNFPPKIAYDCGDLAKWDNNFTSKNYIDTINYLSGKCGTTRKPLAIGSYIEMKNDVNGTPIRLRCIANNGTVATANNGQTQIIKATDGIDQNARSTVVILEYGDFRYFLGGDIGGKGDESGGNWGNNKDTRAKAFYSNHPDIETAVTAILPGIYKADATRVRTSAGHTCCFFVNHHGSGSSNDSFLIETLKPKVAISTSGVRMQFHCHPTQQYFSRIDSGANYSPSWQTPGKTDAAANTVANTIDGYYINEMAADNDNYGTARSPKPYIRTFPDGKILGDIIVRPIGNVTPVANANNNITIQVYGTGLMTDATIILKPLRAAYGTAGNPDYYPLGPFTHVCDLH